MKSYLYLWVHRQRASRAWTEVRGDSCTSRASIMVPGGRSEQQIFEILGGLVISLSLSLSLDTYNYQHTCLSWPSHGTVTTYQGFVCCDLSQFVAQGRSTGIIYGFFCSSGDRNSGESGKRGEMTLPRKPTQLVLISLLSAVRCHGRPFMLLSQIPPGS